VRTLPTPRYDLVLGVLTRDSSIDELASGHCATLPIDHLGDCRPHRAADPSPDAARTGYVRPAQSPGLWTALTGVHSPITGDHVDFAAVEGRKVDMITRSAAV
jgi:hypothetical protein